MKMIRTFQTLGECDQAKALLEGNGIACFIKNEFAANIVGAGIRSSLHFDLPELWIIDDSQEEDARLILES
jgi:hypothetical protein